MSERIDLNQEENIPEEKPEENNNQLSEINSSQEPIHGSPQTENMEVHKHPHHVTHKKKWGEYLLEFLMIFFAVFLGFITENIRENIVENHREKEFIQSLVNDITADSSSIKAIINERTKRERKLDSLIFLLNNDSLSVHTNYIYFYGATASRSLVLRFVPNDGTIQQLKNSGALRLIRNRKVADSIARYDVSVRNILRHGELEEIIIQDYRVSSAKIFDALIFDRMTDANNNVRLLVENPPLLPYWKNHAN